MNFAKIMRYLTKLRNSDPSETFSRLPAVIQKSLCSPAPLATQLPTIAYALSTSPPLGARGRQTLSTPPFWVMLAIIHYPDNPMAPPIEIFLKK